MEAIAQFYMYKFQIQVGLYSDSCIALVRVGYMYYPNFKSQTSIFYIFHSNVLYQVCCC